MCVCVLLHALLHEGIVVHAAYTLKHKLFRNVKKPASLEKMHCSFHVYQIIISFEFMGMVGV